MTKKGSKMGKIGLFFCDFTQFLTLKCGNNGANMVRNVVEKNEGNVGKIKDGALMAMLS